MREWHQEPQDAQVAHGKDQADEQKAEYKAAGYRVTVKDIGNGYWVVTAYEKNGET